MRNKRAVCGVKDVYSRPVRLGIVAALALAPVLAACSSSSSRSSTATTASSGQTTQSTAETGAQATGTPIKVGVICSCSGPLGNNDLPKEDVYKSWVNTVNLAGGISGHPIQLTLKDDSSNPGTSLSDVQTLIADHVDAILDITNYDEPWASAVQAANIPVIGGNVFDVPFYTNPDFYPEGQTTDSSTYSAVATAKAAGANNVGEFYCAEAASCAQTTKDVKSAGQKLGIPLVYQAEISASAPNYTAQCVAAQQQRVAALFVADVPLVVPRVGQDCSRQGYEPIYVTEGSGYTNLLTTAPGIKDNLWSEFSNMPFWSSAPEVQAMNTAVDKYYPGLRNNANEWSELAALEWPSGLLLGDAVKAGGLGTSDTPSAAEVVKGLESLKGDTLDGWAPPLTFTAGQPHPVDCWFTARLQGGVPSLTNDGKVTCESS